MRGSRQGPGKYLEKLGKEWRNLEEKQDKMAIACKPTQALALLFSLLHPQTQVYLSVRNSREKIS